MKLSGLCQDFKMSGCNCIWKGAEGEEISLTTVPENSKNETKMRHASEVQATLACIK